MVPSRCGVRVPTSVLICDDSALARKQMARALPPGLDGAVTFASNGAEGLEAIRAGKGEVLFLDLNMPVMDGYEVLAAIRHEDLPTLPIVVSGDIQPEARQRVMGLGALEFIRKPVDADEIRRIAEKYGLLGGEPAASAASPAAEVTVDRFDGYREIANVAMGRAADLLARLLDAFVIMPVPNVNMIEAAELRMALAAVGDGQRVSAVCQGFIGPGVAGEVLLIFNENSFRDMADLMHHEGELDDAAEMELLMDTSSVVTSACLSGIAEQLDLPMSLGHPMVLGRHVDTGELLAGELQWKQTLAVEMSLAIENRNVSCDSLILFTEDSLPTLDERIGILLE